MVDVQPTNQQPMSDDQELAKVLAGVNGQTDNAVATAAEEPVVTTPAPEPVEEPAAEPGEASLADMPVPEPAATLDPTTDIPAGDSSLDSIKKDALVELRPLVGKLELEPQEKFDTYLLLLRSTDDKDLIAPAHEAAKSIQDETHRAQALLDIIKEIDFLNQQK